MFAGWGGGGTNLASFFDYPELFTSFKCPVLILEAFEVIRNVDQSKMQYVRSNDSPEVRNVLVRRVRYTI